MASAITELVGELSRERWRSREAGNDFVIAEIVAKLVADDGQENESAVIVKGNAPIGEFIPGLTYRFGGRWDDDRVDPRTKEVEKQFKFTHFTKAEPHSRYGLVSYLSKFAPGIGPVIAGRLFDEFGTDAVKVLREFPAKAVAALAGGSGRSLLTQEKAEFAADKLKTMGRMEDTKIELVGLFHGRGFPHQLVDQCIKVWGVLAPKRVARDPFSLLVRRLSGCGFARCDRLYNDLGLPTGRLKRQMICLWHSLKSDNAGNTWFPAEQCKTLLEQSVSGVKVNFVRAVNLGLRSRWLAKYRDSDGKLWLAEFAKAENERVVAERLADMLNTPVEMPPFQSEASEELISQLAGIEDFKPSKEQDDDCGHNNNQNDRTHDSHDRTGSEDSTGDAPESTHAGRDQNGDRGSVRNLERGEQRTQEWQLSSHRMTVFVATKNKTIVDAAPIVKKFVGQTIDRLEFWLSRQGGFERRQLRHGEKPESHTERLARRGRETGICQFCHRELTHPTSRQLGYGPECGPKHGLPWSDDFSSVLESEAVNV